MGNDDSNKPLNDKIFQDPDTLNKRKKLYSLGWKIKHNKNGRTGYKIRIYDDDRKRLQTIPKTNGRLHSCHLRSSNIKAAGNKTKSNNDRNNLNDKLSSTKEVNNNLGQKMSESNDDANKSLKK